jgi:hypothetical protein
MAGQSQPPDEARAGADHLRLKVKIYPAREPTRVEVAEICRRLRDFCDETFSPAHRSTVDVMEGYGMGHADEPGDG